jgi:hypothetical protein
MKTTKPIGVHVPESDYNALRSAANERHISIAALIYALLHDRTAGFTQFDADMPPEKAYVVRPLPFCNKED